MSRPVAIIGCGRIGWKRAAAAGDCPVVVCCDSVAGRAEALARSCGADWTTDWTQAASRPDVEIVIVATTHDLLPVIAAGSARAGKHVLIEKPGARRASELDPVAEAAAATGAIVRVGFNHRYHRAFREAREIIDSGALGDLMFIRARYGHGGRLGYEKEWRADPNLSGGGELIDQGVHLIDLARWFLGDFRSVHGHVATYFWDMPVEDNAFLLLKTADNQTAFLHASWTEWKSTFSFEIYGKIAKAEISGLGGSYGVEKIALYRLLPEMGPPETIVWEFPMADDSWSVEFNEFLEDIRLGRQPSPGVGDAQAALRIVEQVYG